MNVANVKASSAVDAGSSTHKLFQENVVSEGDVEDTVDGENLEIFIKLSLSSWESIENNALGGFWLLHFLVDDLDDNFVAD